MNTEDKDTAALGDASDPLLSNQKPFNMNESMKKMNYSGALPDTILSSRAGLVSQSQESTDLVEERNRLIAAHEANDPEIVEERSGQDIEPKLAREASSPDGESVKLSFIDLNYTVTVNTSKEQQRNGEPA